MCSAILAIFLSCSAKQILQIDSPSMESQGSQEDWSPKNTKMDKASFFLKHVAINKIAWRFSAMLSKESEPVALCDFIVKLQCSDDVGNSGSICGAAGDLLFSLHGGKQESHVVGLKKDDNELHPLAHPFASKTSRSSVSKWHTQSSSDSL
jgi:hypothetical protein